MIRHQGSIQYNGRNECKVNEHLGHRSIKRLVVEDKDMTLNNPGKCTQRSEERDSRISRSRSTSNNKTTMGGTFVTKRDD